LFIIVLLAARQKVSPLRHVDIPSMSLSPRPRVGRVRQETLSSSAPAASGVATYESDLRPSEFARGKNCCSPLATVPPGTLRRFTLGDDDLFLAHPYCLLMK
jgi:hypothetical protein